LPALAPAAALVPPAAAAAPAPIFLTTRVITTINPTAPTDEPAITQNVLFESSDCVDDLFSPVFPFVPGSATAFPTHEYP
jgi:hypothetical protein